MQADVIDIGIRGKQKKTATERNIYTQEIIRVLRKVKEREIIEYDRVSEVIGLDVRPDGPGYGYQHSAREILEREDNIVFEVLPRVGFRRLTPEDVATGTGSMYLKQKRSIIRKSKRRIRTVDDHYDNLSADAKMKVTTHRTILAFDNELLKPKNIGKIENRVKVDNKLIGFNDTIKLFE